MKYHSPLKHTIANRTSNKLSLHHVSDNLYLKIESMFVLGEDDDGIGVLNFSIKDHIHRALDRIFVNK